MRFWDSSALFALITREQGSANAKAVFDSDGEIAIWWGTPVELCSAAARLRRMGQASESEYVRLVRKIGPLVQEAEEVQPNEEVRQMSLRLIRVHDLTAADALQLAAALVWARHVPMGLDFVCMDAKLRGAAEREGFSVLG